MDVGLGFDIIGFLLYFVHSFSWLEPFRFRIDFCCRGFSRNAGVVLRFIKES